MIGGLLKSASRLALVAAAGVIVGGYAGYTTQANAADLGGDCCADLEERVAELEATTARKGNRKVSLTVYGQVNEMVMFWDDGLTSDVYQVTNDVSRSRFGFQGSAKIDSDWSAGYRIEIGIRTANSGAVSQGYGGDPDDDVGNGLDLRHTAWYLRSKTFGTVWVGQTDTASSGSTGVTLANIPHADIGWDATGGGFEVVDAGGPTGITWAELGFVSSFTAPSLSRRNLVKYVTPEFAGFSAAASWGEADYWDVSLSYAGEFSGFRVAGKIAYTDLSDPDFGCELSQVAAADSRNEIDCSQWGGSASIMHVPTGLFVSGAYGELTDDHRGAGFDDNDAHWYVHAGIEQKFFALGKTTLYGEYGETENASPSSAGADPTGGVTSTLWGLGVVQSIDAAAMDMYFAYRQISAEDQALFVGAEDLQLFMAGALIKF